MRKYDIALMLARRFGYTSYLEVCTSTTGATFSQVDKQQFSRRIRLMYRCPADFSDGEQIDLSTEAESGREVEELFGKLVRSGEKFDLVFVDPFHTYAASLRDIIYGLHLIKPGGIVLIHDCNPPNATCTVPEFVRGEWCGLTFAAYLDVVLFTEGLHYCTVDADYGCGIISKDDRLAHFSSLDPVPDLVSQWRSLDLPRRYDFLNEHRQQLLRLISEDEFRRCMAGS